MLSWFLCPSSGEVSFGPSDTSAGLSIEKRGSVGQKPACRGMLVPHGHGEGCTAGLAWANTWSDADKYASHSCGTAI